MTRLPPNLTAFAIGVVLAALLTTCGGCATNKKTQQGPPADPRSSSAQIGRRLEAAADQVDAALKKNDVRPLAALPAELRATAGEEKINAVSVNALIADREKLVQRAEKAEDAASRDRDRLWDRIIFGAVVIGGIGVGLMATGKVPWAIGLAVGGAVVLVCAVVLQVAQVVLFWCAIGLAVVGFAVLIDQILRRRKMARQMVAGIEAAQSVMSEPVRDKVMGIVGALQTGSTPDMVKQEKESLPDYDKLTRAVPAPDARGATTDVPPAGDATSTDNVTVNAQTAVVTAAEVTGK